MTLGLTTGDSRLAGLRAYTSSVSSFLTTAVNSYGLPVSNSSITSSNIGYGDVGVTSDPAKSGIVASFSSTTLGDIPSLQLGNFYIKY